MITKQYQFPKITEKMHDEISKWYEEHNEGRCANGYHGAIGGNVTFKITPTSIGNFITVKCDCGSTLGFDEV